MEVLKATGRGYGMEHWLWKYKMNPSFDPSMVIIVETSSRIVACLHRYPIKLRLGRDLVVDAVLEGDLGVFPEYQRKNLGKALMWSPNFGHAVMTYGFASPDILEKFHSKVGPVPTPNSITSYTKLLTAKPLNERISKVLQLPEYLRLENKLKGFKLMAQLDIKGVQPLALVVEDGRIRIVEGEVEHPSVRIEGDVGALTPIRKLGLAKLVYAFLSRRIKVRGSLPALFNLFRLLWTGRALTKLLRRSNRFADQDHS